jgi:excinuclease ABC subunit A
VYVPCEVCKGARYNRDTLDITWRGKNIAEVLDLPCEEALEFFAAQPTIARQLQTIVDVGLGYVRLGQSAPTLSGGEAQRVKLASELGKRATGQTIYILDEPTTGLHFEDVRRLLGVLQRLVDSGNTVLVIEHNLDVIKSADWIVDLGPEGGSGGGAIVAEGTPEQSHRPVPRADARPARTDIRQVARRRVEDHEDHEERRDEEHRESRTAHACEGTGARRVGASLTRSRSTRARSRARDTRSVGGPRAVVAGRLHGGRRRGVRGADPPDRRGLPARLRTRPRCRYR